MNVTDSYYEDIRERVEREVGMPVQFLTDADEEAPFVFAYINPDETEPKYITPAEVYTYGKTQDELVSQLITYATRVKKASDEAGFENYKLCITHRGPPMLITHVRNDYYCIHSFAMIPQNFALVLRKPA